MVQDACATLTHVKFKGESENEEIVLPCFSHGVEFIRTLDSTRDRG